MSQSFRFRIDELRDNDPAKNGETRYETEGSSRSIIFVRLNGSMLFLYYTYLVAGDFLPEDNKIMLGFTSHNVTLAGVHLESLYVDLMRHLPKNVICSNERYNQVEDEKPIVNVIEIEKL